MTNYRGWEVDLLMGTTPTIVGRAQSMTVDITANIDTVYGVGNLDPVLIKQGPREVTGSMERMYGDDRLWDNINPTGTEQTYVTAKAKLSPNDSDERIITLEGVKFDSWSLDIPQDDFSTESADFTATAVTLSGSAVTA